MFHITVIESHINLPVEIPPEYIFHQFPEEELEEYFLLPECSLDIHAEKLY